MAALRTGCLKNGGMELHDGKLNVILDPGPY